ncbi:MAG: hypothetical protein AAFR13_05390 [Pseudomonadota bacterium]
MKKLLIAMGVATVAMTSNAFAQDVQFNGTVATSCTIDNIVNGSLVAASSGNVLTSTTQPTDAGSADVTATGFGYDITATAPTAWEAASTGTTAAASYDVDMSVGGGAAVNAATPVSVTPGSAVGVTVDLTATAAASTSFENGTYVAVVTLTCS